MALMPCGRVAPCARCWRSPIEALCPLRVQPQRTVSDEESPHMSACRIVAGLGRGQHPPHQPGWIDVPHHHVVLGDLRMESGDTLRDCHVSYVVHGPQRAPGVPAEGVPAVLALSAVASHHHRLDAWIGPGRALDTDRFAVIAVDALGNGLASSPSNSVAQPGTAFPRFTIRDMVASQAAVLDAIGVGALHAVIGASMGGMQALQWAVSHPSRVARVVAMTPMARTTPWSAAVNECSRRALAVGGEKVWDAWVPLMQLLAGRTPQQVDAAFEGPAAAIAWIEERTAWWSAQGFSPLDWLYQSWAYDSHDVGHTPGFGGDTAAALASIRAHTLVAAPLLDLYNPVSAARWAADRIPSARFVELDTDWGHQSASAADPASVARLDAEIAALLAC
jgi:homoserine O-acetyltransferase